MKMLSCVRKLLEKRIFSLFARLCFTYNELKTQFLLQLSWKDDEFRTARTKEQLCRHRGISNNGLFNSSADSAEMVH